MSFACFVQNKLLYISLFYLASYLWDSYILLHLEANCSFLVMYSVLLYITNYLSTLLSMNILVVFHFEDYDK